MKRIRRLAAIVLVFALVLGTGVVGFAAKEETDFKVIGYYSGGLFNEPIEKLQLDKLTHVMYAFLIPKSDGSLVPLEKPEQLKQIVEKSKETGTKVYIALGGWSYEGNMLVQTFEELASTEEGRGNLIDNVVDFVDEYDLDGVEIDWEHPNENTIGDYELLVKGLSKSLEKDGKHLTAALNGGWSATEGPEVSKLLTDECLNSFEFVNIMAYDMNNEDHSILWFANSSMDYWLHRGIPKEKIVLGMPLYARPSWMQYRDLVKLDPQNAYKDYVKTEPLESYYNGLNTLREKTMVALRRGGGVMLFDVNEDTLDDTSAVSMIHETTQRCKAMTAKELKGYITVVLDNKLLLFNEEDGMGMPFVNEDNRTLIPFRKPLEAIGAKITYDEQAKAAVATQLGIEVKSVIGENKITVDHDGIKEVAIDTCAVIKDGRTYLPARAIFEAFGYDVKWSGTSSTVYITKKEPAETQED